MKLTKKTISSGQIVTVIKAEYKLCTMSSRPGYKPVTELIGYSDLTSMYGGQVKLDINEKLEIIELKKGFRAVTYKRLNDNKIYDSWLGNFTAFTRLI